MSVPNVTLSVTLDDGGRREGEGKGDPGCADKGIYMYCLFVFPCVIPFSITIQGNPMQAPEAPTVFRPGVGKYIQPRAGQKRVSESSPVPSKKTRVSAAGKSGFGDFRSW